MYDLSFFRNNLDQIQQRLATRGYALDSESFQELDRRRRACLTENEQLKAERNQASAEIAKLRKAGEDTAERQQQVRKIGDRISELDGEVTKLDDEFRDFLARVPNLPAAAAPIGKDERDNREVRRWGTPPEF